MSQNHADISGDKNPSKRPEVKKKLRIKLIERLESNLELYGKKIIPFLNKAPADVAPAAIVQRDVTPAAVVDPNKIF